MKENDIDRLFREGFQEAEKTPSQQVWQQIENQLDAEDKIVRLTSKKRWWTTAIAATAAVTVFMIGLAFVKLYYSKQNEVNLINVKNMVRQQSESPIVRTEQTPITTQPNVFTKVKANSTTLALGGKKARKNTNNSNLEAVPLNDIAKPKLAEMQEIKPNIAGIENASASSAPQTPIRQVTEVEDIKPLIEIDEETESMLARIQPSVAPNNKSIVTSILNTISENIDLNDNKEIRFRADEEGSFRIDILNSLVKNRNKKRK